jgi:anti-sigma factor RsiW
MIDSKDLDIFLAAYADGELDEARTAEVEALLAGDAAARETVAKHRETAALLRAAFADSQFRAAAEALPMRRRSRFRVPGILWAVAASVLLGVLGYGAGALGPRFFAAQPDAMMAEVAQDHAVYSRETVHLVEVPADQAEHLKAWLGKRVNSTLIIPDFAKQGLTFAGGRLVVLEGEPVAELIYTRANGMPIAYYVVARSGTGGATVQKRLGDTCVATWNDGGHSYFLAGDADSAPLIRQLAAAARTQL